MKCEHYNDIVNLMKLVDTDSTNVAIDKKEYMLNAALSNFQIVDSCSNWCQLSFLETVYIKTLPTKINDRLKA